TTSPETVAAVVITEGVAVMGAATGMLAVRTLATEPQAVIIRQQGLSAPVLAEFARFPLSAPNPAAECMRLGAPVFLETRDAVLARFPAIPRVWESLGTQTLATVPLAVAGETVGAMSFTWTAPRALPPEDREFLLALGRQAAQAIERARLLDAERAARAEAEAAREQAEEAHRAATQASQAKSAFLATMSHELRTPINAMIGYAQLLDLGLAGPLTEQQRGYLDRLAASSQHLLGLVNDVLDLSRIEAGETRVTHDDAWTGTSVAAALDLVLPLAAAKGVRLLDERIDDQGVPYVGDEDRVRQIVVNLLSNAVKFTPREGTITVTCDVAEETPEASGRLHGGGPWAYVRVTDSGVGIPHAEQVRIFEPFHQVDSGHTRRQGGTGLGLAISRRLARLMGGDLSVESTPGVGSTFTLWLPSTRRRGGLPAETAAERGARAERGLGLLQAPGLGEIGELLRAAAHEILHAYTDRLRADPSLPRVRELRRIQLEDHQSSFLADLAQSLVILQEAGRAAAEEIRDGSAIQRIIADAHGSRRFAQGWDEAAVRRDYQILREEIERAIRGRLRAGADVDAAIAVLIRLIERAEAVGIAGWRQASAAAREGEAMPEPPPPD
ncbi:MAG TPA: ATP-binding protein, partial [Gemmatimonadaceae bacterium]|nr:ATP-binding protein [Gemmatimonadaceae bacterium]